MADSETLPQEPAGRGASRSGQMGRELGPLADSLDIHSGMQRRGRNPEMLGLVGKSQQKTSFNTESSPSLNQHPKKRTDSGTHLGMLGVEKPSPALPFSEF